MFRHRALSKLLNDMGFAVLAFHNLTLDELKKALALFIQLVDKGSYALFYFNGHAVGTQHDTYIAGT